MLLITLGCLTSTSLAFTNTSAQAEELGSGHRQLLVTLSRQEGARTSRIMGRKYFRPRAYGVSARQKKIIRELSNTYALQKITGWPIKALGVHCVVFEVELGRSVKDVIALLEEDPRVESAQPMHLFKVQASQYNDPHHPLQFGAQTMQIELAHHWARGKGIRVAVVDTGVDTKHPDLRGRIVDTQNFVDGPARRYQGNIHGTAVAGIIASTANNGIGIVGVAPKARILALKACWQIDPNSSEALCNSFTLAKAIQFAIDKHADVINLSLVGPNDKLLRRLIDAAIKQGITVVTAAADHDHSSVSFPATMEGVVAVHVAHVETVSQDSSERAAHTYRLAAPGVDILTTVPRGGYDFLTGSSMAAAQVSGVVALVLELNPRLSPPQIHTLLQVTARHNRALPDASGSDERMVDACAALAKLLDSQRCL